MTSHDDSILVHTEFNIPSTVVCLSLLPWTRSHQFYSLIIGPLLYTLDNITITQSKVVCFLLHNTSQIRVTRISEIISSMNRFRRIIERSEPLQQG